MGFKAWLGFGDSQRRAVAMDATPAASRFDTLGPDQFPWWMAAEGSNFPLTRRRALGVPAVAKARKLIVGTVSTLPLRATDALLHPVRVPLFEQIDPDVANSVTMAQTVEDLFFDAISWWRVLQRDSRGWPIAARHVAPENLTWQMPSQWPLNRLPSGYYPGSHAWVLGELVAAEDLIRFDSPHGALLVEGAPTIRRALMLEMAADGYARNPQARDYFMPADDADPKDAEVTDMLDKWIAARQLRSTGYVPAGFKYDQVQQMSPADLQLLQQIDKVSRDIANLVCIDPEDVGVSTTSRTYQNAVDRRIDKINECYAPYATAIADRLSMGDVTKRGISIWFDWNGFLKANPLDLSTIHQTYVDMGAMTDVEVRCDLRKPALTVEQRAALTPAPVAARRPLHENAIPASLAPASGPGIASVTPIRPGLAVAHSGGELAAAATFAADAATPFLVFDTSDVAASFEVNEAKRTITGLVVPWGKVGRSGGRRWKFAKDSLVYDPATVNRLKMLDSHAMSAILGRTEKTWSDDVGQWAVFKVARGKDGDRALAQAKDGIKDGLSVGIGYAGEDHGVTFAADPDGDGAVLYVARAPWRETSLVSVPAFDDARVSAVTMSAVPPQNQGAGMTPTATEPQAPAPAAAPAAVDLKPITDAIAAGFASMQAAMTAAAPTPQAAATVDEAKLTAAVAAAFAAYEQEHGPTKVNPVRPGEIAQVTEQPLYRFDGKAAQRCFTADIASGAFAKDAELRGKAEGFLADRMAAVFANITSTNVASLNPAIQRPDLWVPDLFFSRPIGGMMQGGVVDSITKQTLPKFSSASGMAGEHTQGTEPSDGTFVTTSQDITPKAISGRVDINREVIDQGGTPQTDQVIWNEMTGYYAKQLEIRAVAAFVALALTDVPIVGINGDLQTAMINEFATLQFIAGGDRYRGLALNQDLYTAALTAVDGDGRLLFPALNAVNAAGTSSPDLSRIVISTKIGMPAWALATGNSGPAKSFLFVPESCYQWFSAPRRFDLNAVNVSSVGIGIWGYSAEFITRNSDVIQLAYSAS